jgi:hypothetical protein
MASKDPRLERAGEVIGNFIFVKTEPIKKNTTWICKCSCGNIKRFWKKSAIYRQKTCGCGIDEVGFSGKQARSIKSRMQGYKNGAKKRGFDWSLSYEDFVRISTKPCVYCGSEPKKWDCMTNSPSLRKDSPNVNPGDYEIYFTGIDRYNSKLGYTVENSVPCCKNCNRAKSDMSFDEFKEHIKKIYQWLHHKE